MTKRLTGTLEDDNELIVNFVYSHVRWIWGLDAVDKIVAILKCNYSTEQLTATIDTIEGLWEETGKICEEVAPDIYKEVMSRQSSN
jgi:phosphatidylinositol kinase/protein kinase (PI-3  family)